jgi:hypothetical protein
MAVSGFTAKDQYFSALRKDPSIISKYGIGIPGFNVARDHGLHSGGYKAPLHLANGHIKAASSAAF